MPSSVRRSGESSDGSFSFPNLQRASVNLLTNIYTGTVKSARADCRELQRPRELMVDVSRLVVEAVRALVLLEHVLRVGFAAAVLTPRRSARGGRGRQRGHPSLQRRRGDGTCGVSRRRGGGH